MTYRPGMTRWQKVNAIAICLLCILLIIDTIIEHTTGNKARWWDIGNNEDIYFTENE